MQARRRCYFCYRQLHKRTDMARTRGISCASRRRAWLGERSAAARGRGPPGERRGSGDKGAGGVGLD